MLQDYNKLRIKLYKLKKYLEKNDWVIEEGKFPNLKKAYKKIHGEEIKIHIPEREDLVDYETLLNSVVRSLSQIEERNYEDVLEDISLIGYSLLKIRISSKETEEGNILLEHAIGSIEKIRDIIKYEACSVIEPRSDYRKAFQEAIILSDSCELGQTEFGSFVIKIRIPSDDIYFDKLKNKEDYVSDLGIKTISRLMEGILEVNNLNLDDEEQFKKNYTKNLNKRVCQKMSNLLVKEDGFDLELTAKWDPSKKEETKTLLKFIRVDSQKYFKKFGKMSVYLEKIPEEEKIVISGKILDYKLKESKKGITFDKDYIKLYSKDKKRNIHLLLDSSTHEIIGDAIKKKLNIEIEGILIQRENGFWYLEKPHNLKLKD